MNCLEVSWGFLYQGYKYGMQFSRFVKNCLTSRVLCDLNIDLQNPCLIIGQYGKPSTEGVQMIFDCGRLKIESALVNKNLSLSCSTDEERIRKSYDEFMFSFSEMQLIQLPSSVDWSCVRDEPSSEYHILPKTKLQLTLSSSVLETQELPAWKLDVFIKCAKLNMSDSKLSTMLDFLRDLPLPSRSKNMHKNAVSPLTWKIDKKWIVPSIGKLELLYLESQLADYDFATYYTTTNQPIITDSSDPVTNSASKIRAGVVSDESEESSTVSVASDVDMKQFCRAIDLPGFEDNISPHNKMIAVIQVCIKDAGIIFDRASGAVDKSYLYLGATNLSLDVGLLEHGPALQFGVESVKMMDRQAGVDLITVSPFPGHSQVS